MSDEFVLPRYRVLVHPWPTRAVIAFTEVEFRIFQERLSPGRLLPPINGGITRIEVHDRFILAGPVVGAPLAAMALEVLGSTGVRTFISLGSCGSLQSNIRLGDIILPLAATADEGTSLHYPLEHPPEPDETLTNLLRTALISRELKFESGRIWTTDAPFRETKSKIAAHASAGLLAVDMECSAMLAVSRFRGFQWSGLMVVSDELAGETWRPGFKSTAFREGIRRAAEIVLEVMHAE